MPTAWFPAASNHSTLWILVTLLKDGACWKPGTWDRQAGGSQQNHVPEYPGFMPRICLKQQQQQNRKNLELSSREGLQCSSTRGELNTQRTFHSLFITTVGKGVVILYQLDTVRVIWEEGTSNREACTPSQPSLRSQSPWNLHTLKLFKYTSHTRCSCSCDTGQWPNLRYQASPLNGRNNCIKNSICIALEPIPEDNKEEGKTKEERANGRQNLTTQSTMNGLMTAFNTAHSSSQYGPRPSLSPFPTLHETTK